jgi:hypothetical protein
MYWTALAVFDLSVRRIRTSSEFATTWIVMPEFAAIDTKLPLAS